MADYACPKCHIGKMSAVGERRSMFSAGKAAAGLIIAGPVAGLAAGALGKKKVTYVCNHCGYTVER